MTTEIREFSVNYSNDPGFGRLESMNFKSKESIDKNKSEEDQKDGDEVGRAGTKRSTKKKVIHSVFPEEYYPLGEGRQLGF